MRPYHVVHLGLAVALSVGAANVLVPRAVAQPVNGGSPAYAAVERERVAGQLENIRRLIEQSTGSQRVLSSNNELALKIRLHARERLQGAQAAFDSGDNATARQLLSEATKTMFQAIRILGPATEAPERHIADFERRAESTKALLDALQRISIEAGAQDSVGKTALVVEKTVVAARELVAAGEYEDARKVLDGAYETAKAAVEALRDGKTLVRTLTFESDESEYRYEVDRNDTHQMLVKIAFEDKASQAQSRAGADQSLGRALDLRKQAEQRAGRRDFRGAIQLLEESTKELVRAIRSAGLFIPG
jgi:tetratricopeptide (TPR) repeat protein